MFLNRSVLTIVVTLAVALSAGRAPAQAAPRVAPEQPTAWSAQYGEARAAMLAGNFAAAAEKFAALVDAAPDAPSRFLAAEMMAACRTWAAGGFVLAQPRNAQLAAPALLEDRRTTDEISILYTNAVLYGLYAGIVLDVWSEPKSPGSAIPPPLLFAGASAGAVALLDHSVRLRYGVAQSIVSGLYIGIEEGIAWCLWHEAHSPYSSEWGGKAVTTLILATGTVGAVAGGIVGTVHGTTPGRASLMGSAAMWSGAVAGTFMGGMTGHSDTALLSSAIMLNAGAVAGILAGAEVSPSIARVRFIDLGGLSGGLLVGGLYWAAEDRSASGRGLLTATSLGMTAGLVTSWLLTRDMEIDQPRKRREPTFAERLLPTVAPATNGTGFVVGVASSI
jgi:hypothetical protein